MKASGNGIFLQEFVQLGHTKAANRIVMSYYAWNWFKSLCAVVVWWCKPIIVFSLVKGEQYEYYLISQNLMNSQMWNYRVQAYGVSQPIIMQHLVQIYILLFLLIFKNKQKSFDENSFYSKLSNSLQG